jgi:hypothetical protein
MPIDILRESLRSLKTGELAAFHYDFFPGLFPSGELDAGALETCGKFARSHTCRVNNRLDRREIWFLKDA